MIAAPSTPQTIAAPFPGLRPFQSHEADIFCGRAEHVADMLTVLENQRFLAVVGPSGGGKSSLVFAGLIPALRRGDLLTAESDDWRIISLRPGEAPYASLAAAAHAGLPDPAAPVAFHAGDQKLTELVLRGSPLGLLEVIRDARVPAAANILLLVDQFEEIFRFQAAESALPAEAARRRDDAACFVQLLLATARTSARIIHVMLTMRTDFLGDCDMFDGLPQAINRSQFLTPRLNLAQMEEIITGPLQLPQFQGSVDPELVRRILNDVGGSRDELPLVQHALFRTWLRARNRNPVRLTLDDYHAVGGLREALSNHADEARAEFAIRGQERLVDRVLRGLSTRGTGGQQIRRPATVQQLADEAGIRPAEVIAVVEAFRLEDRCFLMPPKGKELKPDTMIDISHESLLRQWKTLKQLTEIETKSAATFSRLRDTALRWPDEESLLRETRLANALKWRDEQAPTPAWAERYGGGLAQALKFLQASEDQRALEAAEQARAARRKTQIRRLVQLGLAVVLLGGVFEGYRRYTIVAAREEIVSARIELSGPKGGLLTAVFPENAAAFPAEALTQLATIGKVETLSLRATQLADNHLPALEELKLLRSLNLSFTRISDQGLETIGRMTQLTDLDLRCTLITDAGLGSLAKLINLKRLQLAPNLLNADAVDKLREKLPTCEVNYPADHPEPIVRSLLNQTLIPNGTALSDRVSLDEHGCLKFLPRSCTDERLWFLTQSKLLKFSKVDIVSDAKLTDLGIRYLARHAGLEAIKLDNCNRISERGFEALQSAPALTDLKLHNMLLSDSAVQAVSHLKNLTSLEIVTGDLTEEGAAGLARLTNLRRLQIKQDGPIPDAVKRFASLVELVDLSLSLPRTPTSAFAKLGELAELKRLDLSGNPNLKAPDLAFLEKLKKLESLNLTGCTGLSATDIQALRERLSSRVTIVAP